jgi:hypothetical protein
MKEVFRLRGKANEPVARKRRLVRDRTQICILLLCGGFFCFALLESPTLAKKDQQPQESSFPMSVGKHVSFEVPGESLKTSPQTYQTPASPASVVGPHPDAGLVINPTFDTSITNNANAAAIQAMVNNAIAVFQAQFSDPITVSILFRYSTTAPDGTPLSSGTLAQSGYEIYAIPWNNYVNALSADAKTANDATANASLPGSALSTNVIVSSANGRALGLNTPGHLDSTGHFTGTFDGIVTLNSAKAFQFTRPPGGNFDAQRSTEHEMDEVLGLGSSIPGADPQPQDLFSWSAPGTRNRTSTGSRYFSINGGTSNIVDFNQNSNGDFGDWLSGSCPQTTPYVQNAFGCAGQVSDVTPNSPEGINLDVIGYDLVTASSTIQFSSSSYTVSETGPRVDITLTRSGNTAGSASVGFATIDDAGLTNCNVFNGTASPRCDYENTIGTANWAAGDATSKTFSIAIVDDSYAEGTETFRVSLNNPSGATLGAQSTATVTIIDNDATNGPNPIDNTNFFVRQQYLDFLGREPDPPGLAGWTSTINNCAPGDTSCDRIHVSQLFFQSAEFQDRGYFVYRFYPVAFGRKPDYAEFVPDLASVSGFLDANQLEAAKVAFIAGFMARPAFANTYNPLTNQQYVDMLLNTAGVTMSSRQAMIDGLNNSTMTRGQVLRQIVESPEVSTKYNHQAYAVMEYFGYLRRQPDSFYLQWIAVLDATNDPRGMVTGFVTSPEYRNRFGP